MSFLTLFVLVLIVSLIYKCNTIGHTSSGDAWRDYQRRQRRKERER